MYKFMGWFFPAGRGEPGYGREYLPDDFSQHIVYKDDSNPLVQDMAANNYDKGSLARFIMTVSSSFSACSGN
jgi:hypothetical protein